MDPRIWIQIHTKMPWIRNTERMNTIFYIIFTIQEARAAGLLLECEVCCSDECLETDMISCVAGHIFCTVGARWSLGYNDSHLSFEKIE
jgi:hypothetical protein